MGPLPLITVARTQGSTTPTACPAGLYANVTGVASAACSGPCAAGRWGAVGSVSEACSGLCDAGYYCVPGSPSARAAACGAGNWCALGSAAPTRCAAGTYGESATLATAACSGPCAAGSYCEAGSTSAAAALCSAGRYGATPGLTNASCTGVCAPGTFCVVGSVTPTPCAAGSFGASPGLESAACTGLCDAGYWCPAGSLSPQSAPCAAGRYGATSGLQDAACSGPCPRGARCGSATVTPERCLPGSYSDAPGASACALCAPGRFAADAGAVSCAACPGGSYAEASGAVDCGSCGTGGALVGAVACIAPATLGVAPWAAAVGGVCAVQAGAEVSCWGPAWPAPFVLWARDADAPGGRVFLSDARGVCVGGDFIGVLLANGSVAVVSGDAYFAPTTALLRAPGWEALWCGEGLLCGRSAAGRLGCVVPSGSSAPPTAWPGGAAFEGEAIVAASAGRGTVCALTANGTAMCARADGTVVVLGVGGVHTRVSLHRNTTVCAIRADTGGRGLCWGLSAAGGGPPRPLFELRVEVAEYRGGDICAGANYACAFAFGGAHERAECATGAGAALPALNFSGAPVSVACGEDAACGVSATGVPVCHAGPLAPACVPGSGAAPGGCYGVAAVAVDAGRDPGISLGDVVEVTFSRAAPGAGAACAGGAAPGFLSFPAAFDAGAWSVARRSLTLTVVNASGTVGSAIDATRVGVLTFRASPASACAGVLSSAASNLTLSVLVTGSWGPHARPVVTRAVANDTSGVPGVSRGDTLLVVFDQETSAPPLPGAPFLSASLGEVAVTWPDARTLSLVVVTPGAAAGEAGAQMGALAVAFTPALDVRARDLSSGPSTATALAAGSWGNAIAAVSGPSLGSLETTGGQPIALRLVAPAGALPPSAVQVNYSAGGRTLTAASCALDAGGSVLSCVSVPGTGAGYRFTASLAGTLAAGGEAASYASPVVTGLSPPEVPTDYNGTLFISGREFGTPEEGDVGGVELFNAAVPSVPFALRGCGVTVSQSVIACALPGLRGAALRPRLRVGGQATAEVSLSTGVPRVDRVEVLGAGAATCGGLLCTRVRGVGAVVRVTGDNFGPAAAAGVAVVASAAGQRGAGFAFAGCAVTVPHTVIECGAVSGYGAGVLVTVSVLGQSSPPTASGLAYAPPRGVNVTGAAPCVGGPRMLVGYDLGAPFPASVTLLVDGAPVRPDAVAPEGGDDPRLDLIVFTVGRGSGAAHSVVVVVGGQRSGAVQFAYDPPVVLAAGLAALVSASGGGGGGAYLVRITGRNFGFDPRAVNVTVGGAPCAVVAAADRAVECATAAAVGLVGVRVSGQASASGVLFNASAPPLQPIIVRAAAAGGPGGLPLRGGGTLTLTGANVAPAPPSVTVIMRVGSGGAPEASSLCVAARALVASDSRSNWCTAVAPGPDDSSVSCVCPRADAAAVSLVVVVVALASCGVSEPRLVQYNAPVVTAVTPPVLPTAGGAVVTVTGTDFEAGTVVSLGGAPCAPLDASPPPPGGASTGVITCVSPRGAGARVVVATASPTFGAVVQPRAGGVSYAPPVITGVVPPQLPTAGGVLLLLGRDFSGSPLIYVGGAPAAVLSVDAVGHRNVSVRVRPGVGLGVDVALAAGDQSVSVRAAFGYAPPIVGGSAASVADALNGGALTFVGSGFGPPGAGAAVTVGDLDCRVTASSDGVLVCTLPPGQAVDDAARVVVSVGGQAGSTTIPLKCPPGSFGAPGEHCAACPAGAVCYGGDFDPAPAAGYFRAERTRFATCVPSTACVQLSAATLAARRGASGGARDDDGLFGNCAAPFAGDGCATCASGYYRRNGDCVPCPAAATLLLALFVGCIMSTGAPARARVGGASCASAQVSLSSSSTAGSSTSRGSPLAWICCRCARVVCARCWRMARHHYHTPVVDPAPHACALITPPRPLSPLAQLLSMFHAFGFPWPPAVTALLNIASVASGSIDLSARAAPRVCACAPHIGADGGAVVDNAQRRPSARCP